MTLTMLFRKRDPERDRYYLLAGMGRRLARKKRRVIWAWSLVAAVLAAGALAAILYWINSGLPGN